MQNEVYSKDEVVKRLQDEVSNWLNARPSRTKSSLAREARSSEACVRRLMNDSVLPNAANFTKILATVRKVSKANELANGTDALSQFIATNLPYVNYERPVETKLWTSFAEKLDNSIKKLIFVKVSTVKKMSAEEIKEEFGGFGLAQAAKLASDGLLLFADDNFEIEPEFAENAVYDSASIKEILDGALTTYFKPQFNTNLVFYETSMVSNQGYGLVMDAVEALQKEILNIAAKHPGNVPLFAGAFMDTMTTHSVFGEGGNNE